MKIRTLATITLAILAFTSQSFAAKLKYLNSDAADYTSIAAPPASGSQAEADDLAQVLEIQAHRTPEECARAQRERFLEFGALFGAPAGPLTAAEVQAGNKLYEQVKSDTDEFVHSIKFHWMRPRPYLESTEVQPCLAKESSSSYPSGHATISRAEALVFGMIYPEKAQVLLERANEVGLDRVIGGVHHPLDIQAGQALGTLLFSKMQSNAAFNKDIQAARNGRPQ